MLHAEQVSLEVQLEAEVGAFGDGATTKLVLWRRRLPTPQNPRRKPGPWVASRAICRDPGNGVGLALPSARNAFTVWPPWVPEPPLAKPHSRCFTPST